MAKFGMMAGLEIRFEVVAHSLVQKGSGRTARAVDGGAECTRLRLSCAAEHGVSQAPVGPVRGDSERHVSEPPRADRARLVEALERYPLPVSDAEGYRTAEVTAGGLPLGEVVTGTLESRIVPELAFCGEMLDVTGRLGGYNFLWAWVSGRRAGEAAARG